MSTTIESDIVTQDQRTRILSDEDQALLDEFEAMLDLIRDRTRSVAERYQVGAYLVGRPGSSKTYTVQETLERLDTPWTYRNSRMSPMGLYCLLEEHPEHIVVLDDISTLFDQPQALQILMAALGGKAGQPRTVTYVTKDERKSFQFAGGIVAISNLPLGRDPLADAVASRVALLEHEPSDEMIAAFMRAQAIKGFKDMAPEECLEVVEFVIAQTRACDYRLDLRSMGKAWEDYRLDRHGKALRPWRDLVRSSLKRLVGDDRPRPEGRAGRIAWERQVARELFERFPDDKAQTGCRVGADGREQPAFALPPQARTRSGQRLGVADLRFCKAQICNAARKPRCRPARVLDGAGYRGGAKALNGPYMRATV